MHPLRRVVVLPPPFSLPLRHCNLPRRIGSTSSAVCFAPSSRAAVVTHATARINDAADNDGDHPAEPQSPKLTYKGLSMHAPPPDAQSDCAYLASIPDIPLPIILPIHFGRYDKPFRYKSLLRHSPIVCPNNHKTKPPATHQQHQHQRRQSSAAPRKPPYYASRDPYDQLSMVLSVPDSGTSTEQTSVAHKAS